MKYGLRFNDFSLQRLQQCFMSHHNSVVKMKTKSFTIQPRISTLAICITILSICQSIFSFAQAPQQFNFQGIARNGAGESIRNQTVKVRFTIHEATPQGQQDFQEEHSPKTNSEGIFNVSVGSAGGDLSAIDWKSSMYYLQIELDPAGGNNFVDIGTSQLVSVPYALHAEEADRLKNDDPIVLRGMVGSGGTLPDVGLGARLIWYPKKAAFRAGNLGDWKEANIGENSTAFGQSLAFGKNSFAVGENAKALTANSIAIGLGSQSGAEQAVSIGAGQAKGYASTAIGSGAYAPGSYATAIGFSAKAEGFCSMAVGYKALAKALYGVTTGVWNSDSDLPHPAVAQPGDRIFQVGNGTSDQNRSNALTVLRNGNVGIGSDVLTPQYLLDVGGRARIRDNGETAGIYFDNSEDQADGFVGLVNDDEIGLYLKGWKFWVNTQGNGYLNGNLIQTSDRRLKINITAFENSLHKINKLQGYHYNWKEQAKDQNLQTGLIAQEVEEYFPELVSTNKSGYKSVNYIGLIPHLIESTKELQTKIQQLEKQTVKIAALEMELSILQNLALRLDDLEAKYTKTNKITQTIAK
ncbi:tail fiber domain-containing protein [Dyadobacter chenhuakuii]|uniref:Tail fiber domain-containing protein n=1 Tax=Dyadobacter chenhuakuii TaxID=2909339 RepID=A0ABY4XNA5_9BACT|nr:tail fiber domain-containing protein [Dyadobacter chenhuakuii]MCF2494740.1 tail fiber domain-containing protein [Dyadobacter chenhuakuii]USJ31939.1 tail fiber domain-containing protein [Dyadobacter chenhuakuii]